MKKVLLVVAAFVALVVLAIVGWVAFDMLRYRAARNPCEQMCLQDSGGLVSCRAECESHPLTYGPAALPVPDGGDGS